MTGEFRLIIYAKTKRFAPPVYDLFKCQRYPQRRNRIKSGVSPLGNHEYYKGAYPKTLYKIKDAASNSNIHELENESLKIDHVCFHGCTLWTDFSLKGNPAAYEALCQSRMNDYKKIRLGDNYAKLRSIDTFRIHQTSRQWLEHSLSVNQAKHNIVVTHHAPSIQSLPMKYLDDPISAKCGKINRLNYCTLL